MEGLPSVDERIVQMLVVLKVAFFVINLIIEIRVLFSKESFI
jgi:hypothetical protein